MIITEKIKAINNKIKQNKAQYDLDRHQSTKFNQQKMLVNIKFCLVKMFYPPKKDLLEKAAIMKRFEYPLLGK